MYLLYQRYTHNTIIIWKETKKKISNTYQQNK